MPIPIYILKRLLYAVPTLILVSIIGFTLMRFDFDFGTYQIPWVDGKTHTIALAIKNPIDPLSELKSNPAITIEALREEEKRLGLDQPMHVQYGLWLSHLLNFDWQAPMEGRWHEFFQPNLGLTFSGEDVATLLIQKSGYTLMLNVIVVLLTWLVALPLGVYAALRWRSTTDRLLTLFSSVGMAAPSFVVAILMGVFVVGTGILPFGGLFSEGSEFMTPVGQVLDALKHLIIPVLVLSFGGMASIQRQMRGNLLDVLQAEYVRLARAKGLAENVVIYKHAVRTAVNPLVTMLGYEFSALLSGALLVEIVLNYPGLGQFIYQAVMKTDTNTVMASLVMSSAMLVLGNLLADILLKLVDPRIELN